MIKEAKVAEYLQPKIKYADKLAGKVEEGVNVLAIGAGKGHEMNEMDMQLPGSKIIGVDPHDHWSRPIEGEMQKLAHDVEYLPKEVSAENLEGIEDSSMDAATFFFVMHHVSKDSYDKIMQEMNRVLKPDGNLFIAEDLVDSAEERQLTEKIDRQLNIEINKTSPHNYASKQEWLDFFAEHGFETVEANEVKPDKVRHGFFVLKKSSE